MDIYENTVQSEHCKMVKTESGPETTEIYILKWIFYERMKILEDVNKRGRKIFTIFFLCCLPFSGDIYFAETFSNSHLNPACFWIFHIKLPSYTIIEYICTGECIGELDYDRKKSHCQQKMMNVTTEVKWNPRGVKVMEQKWQIWKWTHW
ncbi:uncharacterized protein LOC126356296 isoform X11 [Schistocerca gregaria]|uniref:uncharacterized protein LOC126356296 isoform X11 n=1 Tax=Schistocerca gregaria TaxID=7010 RepID=UPI00211DFBA8|nr:uncharacterized protein LOC126356296 isoform X11 [Schistocerca gregaria]